MEFAYLDPGSGSILLQALLGGLAGFAVFFKLFGMRFWRALAFWQKTPPSPEIDDKKESAAGAGPGTDRLHGPD